MPCWVEEMDDDTAYMELVKANNQGELLALEIGIHALEMVGKAQGKIGEGLKNYSDEIGKSAASLTEWVNAAKVYNSLISTCEQVQDKPRHLYEISKAPQHTWQILTDFLIKCDWSVLKCLKSNSDT